MPIYKRQFVHTSKEHCLALCQSIGAAEENGWKQNLFLHKPLLLKEKRLFSSTQRKASSCPEMHRTGLLWAEHMGSRLEMLNAVIALLSRKLYRAITCGITMLVSQNT